VSGPSADTITSLYRTATAIKDAGHLKQWLKATGRDWIVLKSGDLVDGLPWPDGVDILMQIIEAYRQHRQGVPVEWAPCSKLRVHAVGRTCDLCKNQGQVIVRSKTDTLELDELKTATVWMINQILEKDSSWNPFNTTGGA